MVTKYSVSLEKVINENGYEVLYLPCDASVLSITSKEVNRPGLLLAGADPYFDPARVQFLGFGEMDFLNSMTKEKQLESLESLIAGEAKEIDGTESISSKTFLDPEKNLIVDVNVVVNKDVAIKEISAELQKRIKDVLKRTADLNTKNINIRIC